MQSSYQTNRVYTPQRRTKNRSRQEEKPLFSFDRLIIQTVASIAVFAVAYTASFYDSPLAAKIKNEVSYTLDHTIDWQSAYHASQNTFAYVVSTIEKGVANFEKKDTPPTPPAEEATAPITPSDD